MNQKITVKRLLKYLSEKKVTNEEEYNQLLVELSQWAISSKDSRSSKITTKTKLLSLDRVLEIVDRFSACSSDYVVNAVSSVMMTASVEDKVQLTSCLHDACVGLCYMNEFKDYLITFFESQ